MSSRAICTGACAEKGTAQGRGDGVRKEDVEGRKEEKSTWWMVEGEFEEG